MNKKLMLKVFSSLLTIFLITACSQNTEDQQEDTNKEEQQDETTEEETTEEGTEEETAE